MRIEQPLTKQQQQRAMRRLKQYCRGFWIKNFLQLANPQIEHSGNDAQLLYIAPIRAYIPHPKDLEDECAKQPFIDTSKVTYTASILDLPDELLLDIISLLVPTGTAFHIFATTPEGCALGTIINHVSTTSDAQTNHWSPRSYRAALATTSRRLSSLYYSTLYGSNQFVIDLTPFGTEPYVLGAGTSIVTSWSRFFCSNHLQRSIWPLTRRSIAYVEDLTIMGMVAPENREAEKCLKSRLQRAVRLVKAAGGMKRLAVHITVEAPRKVSNYRIVNARLMRLKWQTEGGGGVRLTLPPGTHGLTNEADMSHLWGTLRVLRGVHDVQLSGHITSELMEQLRQTITRADEHYASRPSKRRRV